MRSSHRPLATTPFILLAAGCLLLGKAQAAPIPVNVTTYHNDAARTGQFLAETQLTPATVNAAGFGKLFAAAVDGQVYAQPLYVAGLVIKGQGRHNVVFVATEHDSVYALDAETGAVLWQHSFLNNGLAVGVDIATVPYTDLPGQCQQITPELGVTGNAGARRHRRHALRRGNDKGDGRRAERDAELLPTSACPGSGDRERQG